MAFEKTGFFIKLLILMIVVLIAVFQIIGLTSDDLTAAADNISGSGFPLATLFAANGIVLLVFMAAVLLVLITLIFLVFVKIKSK